MSEIQKPCAICGGECAGQPRTKDGKGRYYHQSCYEEALARKKAARQQPRDASAGEPVAPPAPPAPSAGDELIDPNVYVPDASDDPMMAELFGLEEGSSMAAPDDGGGFAAAPPAAGGTISCPNCGQMLGSDAVICVSCGYDVRKKKALKSKQGVDKGDTSGSVWPVVIGVLCICWGLLLTLSSISNIVTANQEAAPGLAIGFGIFWLGLAAWVLIGGIGVIRRRERSGWHIRAWSIVNIAIGVLVAGCLGLGGVFFSGADLPDDMPPEFAEFGMILFMILAAIVFVTMIAWPGFLLWWFSRAKVQADMRDWR